MRNMLCQSQKRPFLIWCLGIMILFFLLSTNVVNGQTFSPEVSDTEDSDFDEKLRRVAEELESRLIRVDPNPGESGGTSGNGGGNAGGGMSQYESFSNETSNNGSPSNQGYGYDNVGMPISPEPLAKTPGSPGNTLPRPPSDVGSGHDDDVIAKQFREAAEKETNPELREKLWDDYRRYKNESNSLLNKLKGN